MRRRGSDGSARFAARRPGASAAGLAAALATSLLLGCSGGEAPPERGPALVKFDVAQVTSVADRREYVGNVRSVDRIEIRARVRGYLVEQAFEDGARVEKGALLFRIDPAPFEVVLAEARGVLARARAEAQRAERDLERAEALYAQGVVSPELIDQRRSARDAMVAAEQAARAAMKSAQLDLSYATLRAPVAGRMGRALIDVGNLVGESGQDTVLAELVVEDPVRVYFAAPEGEGFPQGLDQGEGPAAAKPIVVRIELGDGTFHSHDGFVDYVAPIVDANRGTITLYAEVPNPEGTLRPGQFVRVLAELPGVRRSVVVPQRAVLDEQGGSYVLIVRDDDTVERRPVRTGRMFEGRQEIVAGLEGGERVIVDGVQGVRSGDPVRPEPITQEAGSREKIR
jgi:membrane fusion protein (multidrug efflux system)